MREKFRNSDAIKPFSQLRAKNGIKEEIAESEFREREFQLLQFTEQIRDVVLLREAKTFEVIYCNSAFETVFGDAPENLCSDLDSFLKVIHEADRPRYAVGIENLKGGGTLDEVIRLVRPDGSVVWLRDRGFPILDDRGRAVQFAHTVEDITARRQADEAMRQIDLRISEAAEEERRRIARDLHDSLGGLLSAIDLRHQILVESVSKGELPDIEAAETVSKLIREGIAESRRLTRGLRPIGDDPEELMGALRDLVVNVSEHSAIRCQYRCPKPVSVTDSRMANELFRIAQEAINNAVKHSDADTLVISLDVNGGELILLVGDDGRGIGEQSTGGESGFGLEIMKHRAQSIGGTLEVAEGVPRGTTVRCRVDCGS